ncbi:hypothetical protein BKK54_03795 [Rodentibacter genomosp. 1]|uniref:HNH nuclease domain-containing protein n=1 Tax=Rodentibacter genomosp. 1 TaxID=1908264 RepID=A0A1V3J7E4_9PAST|nr:HNH endonuclease [Rodentibacter genomosp. 1]OOF51222.1 hypothetical protein BKK54_03795 [Rodentibacter genomosp. 1]
MTDYRNTEYCPNLNNILVSKQSVKSLILNDHPRAKDMHTYISNNSYNYKNVFLEAYNHKCSYCGVSIELLPKRYFEIDHFLYKKSPKFKTKANAGNIDNLVLACHDCNHNKLDFDVESNNCVNLHPDLSSIKDTFTRDDKYYIRVSPKFLGNIHIEEFYRKLKLDSEVHRLDYLLMNLIGFQKKYKSNTNLYTKLGEVIQILRVTRNTF